jgi:hypothetical protein
MKMEETLIEKKTVSRALAKTRGASFKSSLKWKSVFLMKHRIMVTYGRVEEYLHAS